METVILTRRIYSWANVLKCVNTGHGKMSAQDEKLLLVGGVLCHTSVICVTVVTSCVMMFTQIITGTNPLMCGSIVD